MIKSCQHCRIDFEIFPEDLDFYEKISVSSPTLCPDCRQQRRLSFRNERKLYHRKSDLSDKQLISIYSPDKPYKVYSNDEWWSDRWDGLDYGQDFDFGRTFADQFRELQLKVPRLALYQKNAENSDFTNHTENLKNCYLCIDTAGSEEVCFSKWIINCKNLSDCYQLEKAELCYESLYSVGDFNCVYIYLSDNCRDSAFLYDCQGCGNCFMSWNLRNKQYCISNKQYTKEEYEKVMEGIDLGSYAEFEKYKAIYGDLLLNKRICRDQMLISSENCSGDLIYQCKNVHDSYDVINSEDCRYMYDVGFSKDCYDAYEQAFDCERQYECHGCNRGKFIMSCNVCYDISESFYCEMCHNSSNLFGCIGLKRKQYCILNKQYSKEEYEKVVPKIIEHMKKSGEWGEFFPTALSCFSYNETVAQEYYPLKKEEALSWLDMEEEKVYKGPKVEIPDNIKDVDSKICEQILTCEVTGRPYKIISLELEFYKKMKVPIPRKCPDQRFKDRMNLRNPRKLFERNCSNCGDSVKSSFAQIRVEKVCCEKCYLELIY